MAGNESQQQQRFASGAKSLARKLAMQALYRWQINDAPWQDLVSEFATEEGMDRADGEYFRELVQGVHGARLEPPARDEDVLQRPVRLRVHAKVARDPVDDDPAGDHAATASALRTISASARTNRGSSFGISMRSSRSPSSRALACASLSMSQRISR